MSAATLRIPSMLLALAFAVMAGEQPYARTAVVIWDGAAARTPEQSQTGQMLGPVLLRLGLRPRYLSVRQSLPDLSTDGDVRAVISFLDRNRMVDASGYVAWLEGLTAKGKYFVCLGDPGIDSDDQGNPTPAPIRARFWKLLGLIDTGQWEAVTYENRVLMATKGLIGFERQVGPVLPPYRVTMPVGGAALQSHLIVGPVAQKKHSGAKAHLVVTGPFGGYVAAAYTHCEPGPGHRQWYIDPAEFLERALHVTDSPKPDPTVISGRPVLLIVAQADTQPADTGRRGARFETKVQRLAAEFPTLPISFVDRPKADWAQLIAITAEDLARSARSSQLEKALREAETNRVLPSLPGDHQADWERADRARITQVDSTTWNVGAGLSTVRFDHADRLQVDHVRSTGVIGAMRRGGSLFVALDPDARDLRVALSPGPGQAISFPWLVDSRWRISSVKRTATELHCRVKGYGPGDMTWQVPYGGEWWLEVPAIGRKYSVKVGGDGLLATAIPLSAVNGLDIVLRRRP